MSAAFIIAQIIGLTALGMDIIATWQKSDRRLVFFHMMGCLLFALQYVLLGAIPGAAAEIVNAVRNSGALYLKSRYWGYVFIAAYLAMMAALSDTLIDTLPFLSSLCFTLAIYFFSGIKLRLLHVAGYLLSLIYGIYVLSLGTVIACIILMGTTGMTITRLLRKKTTEDIA